MEEHFTYVAKKRKLSNISLDATVSSIQGHTAEYERHIDGRTMQQDGQEPHDEKNEGSRITGDSTVMSRTHITRAHEASLLGLSEELRSLVLSFVTQPEHMLNVALVCQKMRVTITPYMYGTLQLNLTSFKGIPALLSPDNPGLRHVRHLVLTPSAVDFSRPGNVHAHTIVDLIAHGFPRDTLRTLTTNPTLIDDRKALETLHRRQRFLQSVYTGRASGALTYLSRPANKHLLRGIRRAYLTVHDKYEALEEAQSVVQSCPNLKVLELRLELEEYCLDLAHPIRSHFETETGEIFRSLCGTCIEDQETGDNSILPVPKEQLPKFSAMNLCGAHFPTGFTLIKHLDLSMLTALILQKCSHTARILSTISDGGSMPPLKCLVVVSDEEEFPEPDSTGIRESFQHILEKLLFAFKGLRMLIIMLRTHNQYLPDLEAVCNHAASLRLLYLDHTITNNCIYDQEDIAHLSKCTKLEQVALPLPYFRMDSQHLKYTSIADEESNDYRPIHMNCLATLVRLPKLLSLRILTGATQPDVFAEYSDGLLIWRERSRQIRQLVSMLFQARRNLFFDLVSLGRDKDNMVCFLRATQIDLFGTCQSVAVEVDKREACYTEPASEIMNIDAKSSTFIRIGY